METEVTDANGHMQTEFSKEEDEEVILVWEKDGQSSQKSIRELAMAVHDMNSDEAEDDQKTLTYYRYYPSHSYTISLLCNYLSHKSR